MEYSKIEEREKHRIREISAELNYWKWYIAN